MPNTAAPAPPTAVNRRKATPSWDNAAWPEVGKNHEVDRYRICPGPWGDNAACRRSVWRGSRSEGNASATLPERTAAWRAPGGVRGWTAPRGLPEIRRKFILTLRCLQIDAQSHTAEDLVTEATKPKLADVPVQPWHGRSPSTWRGPHPNRSRWTPSDPARRGRVCCVVGATGPRAEPARPSPLDSVGNVDSRIK